MYNTACDALAWLALAACSGASGLRRGGDRWGRWEIARVASERAQMVPWRRLFWLDLWSTRAHRLPLRSIAEAIGVVVLCGRYLEFRFIAKDRNRHLGRGARRRGSTSRWCWMDRFFPRSGPPSALNSALSVAARFCDPPSIGFSGRLDATSRSNWLPRGQNYCDVCSPAFGCSVSATPITKPTAAPPPPHLTTTSTRDPAAANQPASVCMADAAA